MPSQKGKQSAASDVSRGKLRVWIQLLRTTKFIEAELRTRFRRHNNTTLPRADVVAALARFPEGLSMSALSAQLLISNGNVTSVVEKLAADGLVERRGDSGDRRSIRVMLTRKGTAEFNAVAPLHEAWIAEILGGLNPKDVTALLALLAKAKLRERA